MKITFLKSAPRDVPLSLSISVLFGGILNIIGWLFLFVGAIFAWIFVAPSDLMKDLPHGPRSQVEAIVLDAHFTNVKVNRVRIKEVSFEFKLDDGLTYRGKGFTDSIDFRLGQKIMVEFLKSDPTKNKALSLRSGIFPSWVAFVLVFPLIGLVIIIFGLSNGYKIILILKRGELAEGTLQRTEPTTMRINNKPVYRYIFSFEVNGKTWPATGQTTGTELVDEAKELIFYDPQNPAKAVLADALPGKPEVDSNGNLQGNLSRTLTTLLFPFSLLILNLTFWIVYQSFP